MKTRTFLLVSAISGALAIGAVDAASAQGMQDRMGTGMMQGGPSQGAGGGMMQGGMGSSGTESGMNQCSMMHGDMGSGMMGQHMGGMMMGSGMMQSGSRSGMGALFGSRVTPVMNLSLEDVRGYLGLQLQRLNNKRLKIGDLKSDDGTITADVVTVDNSLVQRVKIDRHTGVIQYEN
jgi:hypothetical protein